MITLLLSDEPSAGWSSPASEEPERPAGERRGGLASLADPVLFEIEYDAVASAIADAFQFKVHYKVLALRAAYADWIESQAGDHGAIDDEEHLVAIVGRLIAALARNRIVSFSSMLWLPGESGEDALVFKRYPNEIVALAFGAALFAIKVEALSGQSPAAPLPARLFARAAEHLRRQPAMAADFRLLLALGS